MTTDTELLLRYAHEGSEGAFASLVQMHQKLVLGAAFRRTGDVELARDVAQEVFAGLARKARQLSERDGLAGWLYRAASYQAARASQSRERRENRHRLIAEETSWSTPLAEEREQWAQLEEALTSLASGEQEALVLHYFEDLSYPEMAELLGLSEATVRKRVSRAVDRLGRKLRRRKISAPATAVLAGAAALQASLPAQAGMAQAALAVAETGGATVPVLSFKTIMSYTTSKVAAATVAVASFPMLGQWLVNESLQAEIRHEQNSTGRSATSQIPMNGNQPAAGGGSPEEPRLVALRAEIGSVSQSLSQQRDAREKNESRVRDLERELSQIKSGEFVVSVGEIEAVARRMSELVRAAAKLDRNNAAKQQLPPAETEALLQNVGARFFTEGALDLEAVRNLEREPRKAAHFYASLLADSLEVDPSKVEAAEKLLTARFDDLRSKGLAYAQRPTGDTAAWNEQRTAAFRSLLADFRAQIPSSPDRNSFFDFLSFAWDFPEDGTEGAK